MSAGRDVPVEAVSSGLNGGEGGEEALSWVEVKVPPKQPAGLLHVEVARGALLSHSKVRFLDTRPPTVSTERFPLYADTVHIAAHNRSLERSCREWGKVMLSCSRGLTECLMTL